MKVLDMLRINDFNNIKVLIILYEKGLFYLIHIVEIRLERVPYNYLKILRKLKIVFLRI